MNATVAYTLLNSSPITLPSPVASVPYQSGMTIAVGGVSFSIAGALKDQDSFTLGPNAGGVSDSRNAVALGQLQTSKLMLSADGQPSAYEAISAQLALAVLAGEDQRFAEHHGFDTVEIERALSAADQGGKLRGASTISQQVAKNLFLWSGRSYVRKALEAWFTLLIEACWSKRRILEMHLNLAQYGPRTFGAEAAAQRFFGKPAWDLDTGEAARLAAVLPNPRLYRVEAPNATVRTRERHIRTQMRNLGGTGFLDRLSE